MKKYIYMSAMAALMLASCAQEELSVPSNDGNVTFSVTLPSGINTRAYSDGTTATKLTYVVYDENKEYIFDGTETFGNLQTTVSLDLVTGKEYNIAFWADAPENNIYKFDKEKATITVATSGNSQDENRDAFFASYNFTVNGAISETITLTRPFAQINIGTSDYKEFTDRGESISKSGMVVKGYSTLNLLDGSVDDEEMVEYTFDKADFPVETKTGAFPYSKEDVTYKYIAMNYILIGDDKTTVDVKWTNDNSVTDRQEVTFYSVPVQRNYRTNIFGALLTNPAVYDVEISEGYDGSIDLDQEKLIADGVYYNPDENTYSLTSVKGVEWLAKQMNEPSTSTKSTSAVKGNTFSGETIRLINDVDLAGIDWAPLGLATGTEFLGTFDGCGNTIYNMTVDGEEASGFFYHARNVKNLNFKNATVTGHYKAGVVSGDGANSIFDNCHVDGAIITVTPRLVNGYMDDANNVGGIVGMISAQPQNGYDPGVLYSAITNCSVKNATIIAYRKVGGIVGAITKNSYADADQPYVTGNTVENVKVIANMTTLNYNPNKTEPDANEIIGAIVAEGTVKDNVATNVTVSVLKVTETGDTPTIEVGTAVELQSIAEIVNSGANDMFGITIKLTEDIAFDPSENQQPIGNFTKDSIAKPFAGTFDGNNKTISGFTSKVTEYKHAAGFIGYANYGATIQNLKLKNITVEGTAYTGGLIGMAYKDVYSGSNAYVTVKDVEIDTATVTSVPAMGSDGKYDGGNNVGALIGLTQFGMHVEGCKVTNATVTGYVKVGGMIGTLCNANTTTGNYTVYKDNSISNSTVIQSDVNAYDDTDNINNIGEFYGYLNNSALPDSNTATNVTVIKLNE